MFVESFVFNANDSIEEVTRDLVDADGDCATFTKLSKKLTFARINAERSFEANLSECIGPWGLWVKIEVRSSESEHYATKCNAADPDN